MESELWDILPKYFDYKIVSFEKDDVDNFDATFKVNLFDEVAVKKWLKQFEQCSFTNFRVARTAPAKQTRVLFKKYYRCHHNTRASESASKTKKAHVKHTGCEATLLITVNNSCMKSCKQPDVKRFPCTVKYHNFHNHPLSSEELLCHRKPSERIEQKIRELLLKNHTPVSALKILKQDLQQEFKDEYSKIVKDGAFCPKLQWVYHKYYSIFKEMCDPYKLKYSLSEFMIEEFEETDSEAEMSNDVAPTLPVPSPLCRSPRITSSDDNDITYEEYILSSEDKSLFDNHLVEVYTVDENDLNDDKKGGVYTSDSDIADLPIIGEEISDSYDQLSIMGNDITSKNDYDKLIVGKEIVVSTVELDPLRGTSSSELWNDGDIKHKIIELNAEDLSDIFGDSCNDMKLNSDIFLPSIKDEIDYEQDKT